MKAAQDPLDLPADRSVNEVVREVYRAANRPHTVTIELTRRCNLRCIHCYAEPEPGRPELSTGDLMDLLSQIRDLGTLFVSLLGGDPTLHRDFLRLVGRVTELRMCSQIVTNGTLIDEAAADVIAEQSVFNLSVSLYGARPETHDAITRRPGSFGRTVAAIRRLKERGVYVVIKVLLQERNVGEFEAMRRLARDLGAEARFSGNVMPRDSLDLAPVNLRVPFSDTLRFSADRAAIPDHPTPADRSDFDCMVGKTLLVVNAYGDVFPCIQTPICAGNVRYTPLAEIWEKAPLLRFLRQGRHLEGLHSCPECALRGACNRCPGLAFTERGDFFGPSASACAATVGKCLARRETSGRVSLPAGLVHDDSRPWRVDEIRRALEDACSGAWASGFQEVRS